MWDLCGKIADGGPIELGGSGKELRDWIDVRDVVRGLEQLSHFTSTKAPVVNLATGAATSVQDIAALVADCWASSNTSKPLITFSGKSRPGDPYSLIADTTRMHSYGIDNYIKLEESIAEYVSWYKTQVGAAS